MKKLLPLAFAALIAGPAIAAPPTEAEFHQVLQYVAQQLNESVAKAPAQTDFIQFESAEALSGRRLLMLHRMPQVASGNGVSKNPAAWAKSESMLRPIVLKNLCKERLPRQLLSDKVTLVAGFVAANNEPVGVVILVEKDCKDYPMPKGVRRG